MARKIEAETSDYHNITVILNDGSQFQTKSCFGQEGSVIKPEVDPTNHPAWRTDGSNSINTKNKQLEKFNNKFADCFA